MYIYIGGRCGDCTLLYLDRVGVVINVTGSYVTILEEAVYDNEFFPLTHYIF